MSQELSHARSAAVGLYFLRGSRDEGETEGGLSHLLEHLLFKGTGPGPGRPEGRSARELAVEMDLLGGRVDAWTQRETTGFEAEVLPESLPRALALLGELVTRPALPPEELEREREVIREEIRGAEDDPSDVVGEQWARWSFPDHPLGRPVLGTERDLDSRCVEELRRFFRTRHRGGALLACAAGRLAHDELVEGLTHALAGLPAGSPPRGPEAPPARRGLLVERRDHLEQAHVVLSLPGLAESDPAIPTLDLLVVLLGASNSSRLWQRIREEEGLTYDLSLSSVEFRETGRLTFECECQPDNLRTVLRLFQEETARLLVEGPDEEEVERARESLRAGLVLEWEGAAAHLDALSDGLIVHGRPVGLEERLSWLESVTRRQVHELGRRLLGAPDRGLVVLGPSTLPRLGEQHIGPRS